MTGSALPCNYLTSESFSVQYLFFKKMCLLINKDSPKAQLICRHGLKLVISMNSEYMWFAFVSYN